VCQSPPGEIGVPVPARRNRCASPRYKFVSKKYVEYLHDLINAIIGHRNILEEATMSLKFMPLFLIAMIFLALPAPTYSKEIPTDGSGFDVDTFDFDCDPSRTILVSGRQYILKDAGDFGFYATARGVAEAFELSYPGCTIFLAPGEYEAINFPEFSADIRLTGFDASITSDDPFRTLITLTNCYDIEIDYLNLFHDTTEQCYEGCINITGCEDIRISNCNIHGSGYYGIWVDNSEVVRIVNNDIHDCFWAGIAIWDFPYWVDSVFDEQRILEISGNYFYGNDVDLWKYDDPEWDSIGFYQLNIFDDGDGLYEPDV